MNAINRMPALLAVLMMASLVLAACGGDGATVNDPVVTQTPEEFYAELEVMSANAAAEISRIDSELQGGERLEAAADVYDQLAEEVDTLEPPVATAVVDQALVLTAQAIAEELRAVAGSGESSSETLESYMDDYEYVCVALVDTANAIIGGTNLDCTFGFQLID